MSINKMDVRKDLTLRYARGSLLVENSLSSGSRANDRNTEPLSDLAGQAEGLNRRLNGISL